MKAQITPGSKVRIPSGTEIQSTNSRNAGVTKRARTVTVHRVDNGSRVHVGWLDGTVFTHCTSNARSYACYGGRCENLVDTIELIECANSQSDLLEVMAVDARVVIEGSDVFLVIMPPMVTWAGAGGYWCWAPLATVVNI